jgi:predicted ATPase
MHLEKITLHPDKYPTNELYPFNLDVLCKTESITFATPVTFFIGENGTGKSTLLRAICQRCNIFIWEDTERMLYEPNPYLDKLYRYIDVYWADGPVPGSFFGSQIFQDFARFLDEMAHATPKMLDYYGGSSLMAKSHGESLLQFFAAMYKVKGLHFLDEPETAFSPRSQLKLLRILKDMVRDGHAQFIIATHSPILLALPGATIYSLDSAPIKQVDYEETEYFTVYKDFMENREKYLREI